MVRKYNFFFSLVLLAVVAYSCKKNIGNEFDIRDPELEIIEYDKSIYKKGSTIHFPLDFPEQNLPVNYVEFRVGDLNSPIILSSPHDGTLAPDSIGGRDHPTAEDARDTHTTPLVERIADTLEARTGMRPHIIVNVLSRKKMDPNRSRDEAFVKHPDALDAWDGYQNFLKIARQIVTDNVGKGLYLDIHGHGHPKDRIEVGYLLTPADLNDSLSNFYLDLKAGKSSIFAVGKGSLVKFSELIRGASSFGALLWDEKHPAVPSDQPGNQWPGSDDYFNGGYCTLAYGSLRGGNVSAIQLETSYKNERDPVKHATAGGAIARATINYFKLHYGMNLQK
ncbi:N-formylglutamate amidohydrolase [Desertivirga xinjiangensis]|uniref:N-formylglutamate amidohydrolase n=1 Tax=Desertivirga xinjiangensis TaxID=539206 RepID=UPI00210A9655|nr:N-formylglutamate amidohydrolase [Pedobacter xinjiangensis]